MRLWLQVAVIVVLAIVAVILLGSGKAGGGQLPQWSGFAGAANHACYNRGGVKQIWSLSINGTYAVGWNSQVAVVCNDGWVFQIGSEGG